MGMDQGEQEESFRRARDAVLRLLKFRARSEQELRGRLGAKNFPLSVIERTIRHFKEADLINDGRFARQWASSRLKKPFGIGRIRLELKKKGIDGATIREVLDETARHYDEPAAAAALARRRAGQYRDIGPEKIKRRVYGYLRRRGFSAAAVIKAIQNI